MRTQVNLAEEVSGVLPVGNGGTGNTSGEAESAAVLSTPRQLITSLEAGIGSASFDGSSNVVLGVAGVLPAANGGTGTTAGAVVNEGGASGMWIGAGSAIPSTGVAGVLYVTTS